MSDRPADRIAARRSTRPMPAMTNIAVPREGQPAVKIGAKRSVERPHVLNTSVTDRTLELIDELTRHYRKRHGRTWRINMTLEQAIEHLARDVGLTGPTRERNSDILAEEIECAHDLPPRTATE